MLEASQHGIELPRRIEECLPARRVKLAGGEDAMQRLEPVAAVVQRPLEIGGTGPARTAVRAWSPWRRRYSNTTRDP